MIKCEKTPDFDLWSGCEKAKRLKILKRALKIDKKEAGRKIKSATPDHQKSS